MKSIVLKPLSGNLGVVFARVVLIDDALVTEIIIEQRLVYLPDNELQS